MQELKELIKKYNEGTCTAEEKAFVENWYQFFDLKNTEELPQNELLALKDQVWLSMHNEQKVVELKSSSKTSFRRWYYIPAAAVTAAILGLVVFQFYFKATDKPEVSVQEQSSGVDIAPGSSKAQLVLGNGKVVGLGALNEGSLTEADGTVIDRQSGKLIYKRGDDNASIITYNTLLVPRGGEYQLLLSDGSKVWLNAASSLKYPTRFGKKERLLYLSGEAYFDVKRDTKLPFKVVTEDGVVVEVLGTKFNVMSYNDEKSVNTTLESGSVKVVKQNQSVLLRPAQVGEWQKENKNVSVKEGDLDKVLAWKNGMIEFREDEIEMIMRQI